jgi:hypothetical protein
MSETPSPIIAGTRIGHVHLKVADLDRALGFYCGVLGFEIMQRLSSGAAFISAGGYHHHIGLNTWESKGGHPRRPAPPACFTPLYSIRPALRWRMRCIGSYRRESSSMAPAITASAKRCICAIPTRTASSCIGIGPRSSGRERPTDRSQCSPTGSTSTICCGSGWRNPHGEEAPSRQRTCAVQCAVSNHEKVSHQPSRRGEDAAPQDEVLFELPRIMISAAAVSSRPMQP